MLDTKGPEYRIGCFKDGKITLKGGDRFIFTARNVMGDENIVSVSYKALAEELKKGDTILLSNGLLSFEVQEISGKDIITQVLIGGELSDRKSMSFPGKILKQKYLSDADKEDISFGVKNDVDFIACSFVSNRDNLNDVKEYLGSLGSTKIELIAKIENQAGVDNIEEISSACDGIMIGRGDLGVEIPFEELPAIQKRLITKCRMIGNRVITATEMLESMINNPRPTRAETSDVANAVYDGTSAIMLSGETAFGKYPVLALETMDRIARQTENNIHYKRRFQNAEFIIKNTIDAVSHATCGLSIDVEAKAVVVCTLSGMTARLVSRFRGPCDILAMTTDEKTYRKLSLSFGVTPILSDVYDSTDVLFFAAKKAAEKTFSLSSGDRIIITGGITNGISGNTNMLKVEII